MGMKALMAALVWAPLAWGPAVFGDNLLKNGDFEAPGAGNRVPGWYFGCYSGGDGTAATEPKMVHGGNGSARLTQHSATGWVQLVQARTVAPYPAGTRLKVGIWYQCENVKAGSVIFFGKTAAGAQRQWQSLRDFKGTGSWRHCEKTITLEGGLTELYLAIRLNGPGMVWADDAEMTVLPDATTATLANPAFAGTPDATGDLAPHWSKSMVNGGETAADFVLRDGVLELIWRSGGAEFGAATEPTALPEAGSVQSWSAEVRTAKQARAVLAVTALDARGEIISAMRSPEIQAADFQRHQVVFRMPAEVRRLKLECVSIGDGPVQFRKPELAPSSTAVAADFPIQALPLPVTGTETWNGGRAEFNTFSNAPVPLAFHFQGDASGLTDPALVIEIPAELKLTEVLFPHTNFLTRETPRESAIERQGRAYRRYEIVNPRVFKQLARAAYAWERKLAMTLEPAQNGCENQSFDLYWYFSADGGRRRSEVRHFPVNILPPLEKLPNPKNFPFICYTSEDLNFNDPARVALIASNYEEANMNSRSRGHSTREIAIDQLLEKRGWRMCVSNPDFIYENFVKGSAWPAIRERVEFVRWFDGAGKPGGRLKICPQYFSTDPEFREYFRKFLVERMKAQGLKNGEWVIFDTEPWETMDWCFCDRCRKDFAAYAKLAAVPTAEEIRRDHRTAWREFRCQATARITQMHGAAIRSAFPDTKIIDYDYVVNYADPNFRNYFARVAKDPQLDEAYFDAHFASYYHYVDKNAFDMIALNIRNLKKDYWVIGAIDRKGYLSEPEVVTPAQFRMLMLAAATAGAKGFGLWPGKHIDGKFFVAINQAMYEIARIEPVLERGKLDDAAVAAEALPYSSTEIEVEGVRKIIARPNWKTSFGYHAWTAGPRTLAALFNYNSEEPLFVRLSLKLPPGNYTILNPVDGRRLDHAENRNAWTAEDLGTGIVIPVRPRDVTFVEIRPAGAGDAALPAWADESVWRKRYRERCESFGRANGLRPCSDGKLKIGLQEASDGTVYYLLESPVQKLLIAPDGGLLKSWRVDGRDLCGTGEFPVAESALLHDFFWLPEAMRNGGAYPPPAIIAAGIDRGQIIFTLADEKPRHGLVLQKSFIMGPDKPEFEVRYELRNSGRESVTVAFWSHNFPKLGDPARLLETMCYRIPTTEGVRTIAGTSGQYLFPSERNEHPGFPAGAVSGVFRGNTLTVSSIPESYGFTVAVDSAQLMMVYAWFANPPTLEWMYRPMRLAPNQSWQTVLHFHAWRH